MTRYIVAMVQSQQAAAASTSADQLVPGTRAQAAQQPQMPVQDRASSVDPDASFTFEYLDAERRRRHTDDKTAHAILAQSQGITEETARVTAEAELGRYLSASGDCPFDEFHGNADLLAYWNTKVTS